MRAIDSAPMHPGRMRSPGRLAELGCLLVLCALPMSAGFAQAPSSFIAISGGAEIVDQDSGLVWARCALGMQWSGKSCTGAPLQSDRATILASLAETGKWRLPRVEELQRLALAMSRPGSAAARAFPVGPKGWYWTASSRVRPGDLNQYDYSNIERGLTGEAVNQLDFLEAYAVSDDGRQINELRKTKKLLIRVVRIEMLSGDGIAASRAAAGRRSAGQQSGKN